MGLMTPVSLFSLQGWGRVRTQVIRGSCSEKKANDFFVSKEEGKEKVASVFFLSLGLNYGKETLAGGGCS